MKHSPAVVSSDQSGTAPTPPPLPWFTADELPLPPPEMRLPMGQELEPTLFDDDEAT